MKLPACPKPPSWYAFATAMLKTLIKSIKPEADAVTEAEIATEIRELWAKNALETTVSPEEASALVADDEDLIAADQTGRGLPDEHIDLAVALLCARTAQCLATTRRAAEMARPGALTVLHVNDTADLTILGAIVRNSMFPAEINVSSTVRPDPKDLRVHHISIFRGEGSSDSTLKLAIKQIEDALPRRHALLVTLSDMDQVEDIQVAVA